MDYSLLWLDFQPLADFPPELTGISAEVFSSPGKTALTELQTGLSRLSGHDIPSAAAGDSGLRLIETQDVGEGYVLRRRGGVWELRGSGAGLLYGAFRLLRMLGAGEALTELESSPRYPLRMLDHWDNADGQIERGYSGLSFFFENGAPVCNARTRDYARLLASCGLNGCCINNVNVKGSALKLITGEYDGILAELSRTLEEYHVGLWLCVSFAAPMEQGGLPTADPLDPAVFRWWRETVDRLYSVIPDLKGFLVKADSEGRPGPFSYGRSHAEGANMLARALNPHGGQVLWRCFVYNCAQDWRDASLDRARAQYDNFAPLDGQFDDNVLLQIKNGPVDFQIREPVSPLFGKLDHTRSILEFQIAQEYTGQQRHVCCLLPMMREVLDFPIAENGTVADRIQAVCAVSNTGSDFNWCGHDLASANLYGFGLLSWDPSLAPEAILREWCRLTLGRDERVCRVVTDIQLRSRRVYEQYTAPLGLGWLCSPGIHYGPAPDGYEYDRWGTYHRASCRAVGVERGPAGTGYSEQYRPALARLYGSLQSCPEELLLFFHRVPFDYRMRDGRTLLQRIYDDHFEGVEAAEDFAAQWESLRGLLPEDILLRVSERFREQLRSAREWRDVVNSWLYRLTMIPDARGREVFASLYD